MLPSPMTKRDVACILIVNERNEILMQKKDVLFPSWPGCWSLFGGGLDEKEDPKDAISRETKEELGLELKDILPCKVSPYKEEGKNGRMGNMHVFTTTIPSTKIAQISIGEGAGFAWLAEEEFEFYKSKVIPQDFKIIIDYYNNSE